MKNIWQDLPKPFLVLAPMEGVTDTVFRQVVMKAGRPDLMFTEFTSVDGLASRGFPYVARRLQFTDGERPLIAQLWGKVPENFYAAAKLVKSLGFDGIDINLACPAKEVLRLGGGAALIDNPPLSREIIQATHDGGGGLPVSVKTRLGNRTNVADTWIPWLLESGIEALTLHTRTAKEMSKVPAHWEEIGKAVAVRDKIQSFQSRVLDSRKRGPAVRARFENSEFSDNHNVKTLIIGNGDVGSRADAMTRAKQTGVDGVMIGRGIFQNPWLFKDPPEKSNKEQRLELLRYHLDLFDKFWQGEKPFVTLRKYFKIYVQGFRGAVKLREQLMHAVNRGEVEKLING